jgi:hypothetical protein
MVENKIWDDAQKKMFYDSVTSADVARMFHSAIQNFNVLRAGNFASVAPAQPPAPHQYSLQDRTDMYRKAFELMKTNKLDGETELSRLDKLFAMK